ncbi:MAG TPA: BatD family protein [Candidatus Cloacimonadota bacterium]|nr:BatD family protein [Candidatus Cloacimonadota bacterium]
MKIRTFFLLALSFLLLTQIAVLNAESLVVRSYAEPTTIGRDEQTTYTIEVTGDKDIRAKAPKLPNLTDFSLISMMTSSSSNYSIVNGNVRKVVTKSFNYVLLPRKTGNLKIPSFSFEIGGRMFSTQTVNVRVLDLSKAGSKRQSNPQGQSQTNPFYLYDPFDFNQGFEPIGEMDILAVPEKKQVYIGEPFLVTYRLYTNQPVATLELIDEKDFGGYGKEIYSESSRLNYETVTYKGQRYKSAVLKTVVISPNRTGSIQVPELTVNVQIGSLGLYGQTLNSKPAYVQVNELPQNGKPADFTGAVGSFKVSESLNKNVVRIGEALEYKFTISGRGNFNQFSNPDYPPQPDFRIATPITENRIQSGISGTRTITYILIPKREGNFTLPGIRFNWFDPSVGRYLSFHSSPRSVIVKPGNVLTYLSNVFQKENIRTLTPFEPESNYRSQVILLHSKLYWLAVILILLSLIPSWLIANKNKLKEKDPDLAAQRGSARVLKKYLKQAETAAKAGSSDFYPQAEQGLMHYLSDKYHIPNRYSTQEKIYHLRLKGLDNELIENLEAFLKHCQEARFKPGGFQAEELDNDLDTLKKVINSFINQPDKRTKF